MDAQEIKLKILELVIENMNEPAFDVNESMNTDVDTIIGKADRLYKGFIL